MGDAGFRNEVVKTFADQARQQLFDSLFKPLPGPAQAGDTSGFFGGANFAFK